ncbi:SGNH/GDSL hydrolase family protein [Sphingomonas sp. BIUV-7]|uniref:SGNH/GDSL hydrolase family protein n=1 Tax=Sphingomonas natans TaxID=3063330 RepID=A0ABT8Y937_9SPHN|nr:SGNH/GDSL hydrolase family protein [Sphingomonas sp. BIUV-7]MDO6414835.1 SGNH/GDSL hydrolase family protein [Sphingomonas sp. BIUV-7]
MIGLLLAAGAALGAGEGLSNTQVLQPFFAKLAKANAPGAPKSKPLHILQIGDSHSAGDMISGALRETLQGRYGGGGRGVLAPGRPYDGYLTRGVTVSMSPDWSIASDFGKGWGDGHPPLGLSAFTLTSRAPGATMALEAEASERFDRVVLCAMAGPGAGALTVRIGDQSEQRLSWASASARPECRTLTAPTPQTHVDITTDGGPVTLTSWATFFDHGGIALSNVGVVGSQLVHFGRTDDSVVAEEMQTYDPDLIVLAFGTNEGFAPRVSPFEYEAILRSQIGRIRRLAGNVPILLLGAPDALTRRSDLLANGPGGDSSACRDGGELPVVTAAAPVLDPSAGTGLAAAMAKLGTYLGVTQAPTPPKSIYPPGAVVQPLPVRPPETARNPLFPPAGLSVVRDIQRRVATSLHVAFWDWEGRMGGRCTALRWVRANPPLMRSDYVHYTKAGGKEIADRLQADLDRASGAK